MQTRTDNKLIIKEFPSEVAELSRKKIKLSNKVPVEEKYLNFFSRLLENVQRITSKNCVSLTDDLPGL